MLEGELILTIIPLLSGIGCLGCGIFAYYRNPTLRVSRIFLAIMAVLAATCFFQFLFANATDDTAANIMARALAFLTVVGTLSLIYLVSFVPIERLHSWPVKNFRWFALILLISGALSAVLNYQYYRNSAGYWFEFNNDYYIWGAVIMVALMIPAFIATYIYISSTDRAIKTNSMIIALSILLPFVSLLLQIILVRMDVLTTRISTVGIFVAGLILVATQFRHKIHVVAPVNEGAVKEHIEKEPTAMPQACKMTGHCDMVKSKRSDPAYRMFISSLSCGRKGLVITRVHPDQVRERYGLVNTPVLWLSSQPGPERVDPASLSILQHTIVDFLQKDPSSIILLDGLEYLMSENSMDKVLRFVYAVHDAVVVSASTFIVPLDPDVMSVKEMALIEKEFIIIEPAPQVYAEGQAVPT